MSKRIKYLLVSMLLLFSLTGCNHKKLNNYNEEIYRIYELAKEDGYQGTYEEWLDSIKGEKGDKGDKGNPGEPGKDGSSPLLTIGSNGNWYINGLDTGVKAQGEQGVQGETGPQGQPGKDGVDGHTPLITIGENGNWFVDGIDTGVKAQGSVGESGKDGKTAEFRINEGYLEWKYTIDTEWTRLFKLNSNVSETVKVKYVYDYEDELDQNGNPIPIKYEEVEVPLGNIKEPTDVTKEGYRFKGWMYYDEYDKEYKLWKFNYYSLSTDITLYALWEKEYTVTFVGFNGEVIKQEKVVYGETVDCPKISAQEGLRICWTNNESEYSNTYTLDENSDVTLTAKIALHSRNLIVYTNSSSVNNMQDVASKFEEKFPSWTIEIVNKGSYEDVKNALFFSLDNGTQPDLAICYPDHVATYIRYGKVVDMSQYIDNQNQLTVLQPDGGSLTEVTYGDIVGYTSTEKADFVTSYFNEGYASNYDNYASYGYDATDILTMPYQKSTDILYYNADALIELGYYTEVNGEKVANAPKTWDELWEICYAAKAKWPNSTPFAHDSESNWFITMCKQSGWDYTSAESPYYLFNNENTQNWLSELKGYYDNGLITTFQMNPYGYSSTLYKEGKENGCIFAIGSSAGAKYQNPETNFKWGISSIPGVEKSDGSINNSALSQGPSLVMFESNQPNAGERALMTWQYVKMLLEAENQANIAGLSGYLPVRYSSFDVPSYKKLLEDESDFVVSSVLCAKSMYDCYFISPLFNGSLIAREQVGSALLNALSGCKTPEKALEDALNECYLYS